MADIIKKKKSAYGKRKKEKSKTYDAYKAAMADRAEADSMDRSDVNDSV